MIRFVATLAVLVAGACTTAMNWRFSYQLGSSEFNSYTWATFSVALDVTKWLMLPCSALAWRNHRARSLAAISIWLVATIYSFTAAIGFAALNRGVSIADRQHQVELLATLKTIQQSPRWQSTAACADATSMQSKEFCSQYRAIASQILSHPADADPQSTLLAQLTGLQTDTVRLILSIFLATACEVISALGLFAILPATLPTAIPIPRIWQRPKWQAGATASDRDMARPGPTQRDTSRPTPTWKSPR